MYFVEATCFGSEDYTDIMTYKQNMSLWVPELWKNL